MQAVVFLGDRQLELREFPDPTPAADEVVLEMKASGMCGSDLKFYRVKGGAAALGLTMSIAGPIIAGHEPCGVVAEVGSAVREGQAKVGQRVMVHHYKGCGFCNDCQVGWAQLCRAGAVVYGATDHGAHARYMKVPASTLVPLPESLSFETGAAISCGTATAYNALRRLNLHARDTIAIFGQGPVGLSATQFASAMGARVLAVDISPERLALAQSFGADAVVNSQEEDPVEAIQILTHGEGTSLSLDCSGIPEARVAAVRGTRTWGSVCFVGEGDTVTLDVSQDLIRKQLTLIASWTFSNIGQQECARFVEERKIPVDHLFTHRFTLAQAAEAYQLFDQQTTGKGVFLL